jgi:hypothetical protein
MLDYSDIRNSESTEMIWNVPPCLQAASLDKSQLWRLSGAWASHKCCRILKLDADWCSGSWGRRVSDTFPDQVHLIGEEWNAEA